MVVMAAVQVIVNNAALVGRFRTTYVQVIDKRVIHHKMDYKEDIFILQNRPRIGF